MSKHRKPPPGSKSETASALKDKAISTVDAIAGSLATTSESFIKHAAISDIYEIESAQVALERSRRGDVRNFAHEMLADHQKTSQKLRSCVNELHEPPPVPGELDTPHRLLIDDLRGADDKDFDHRYLSQQKDAHKNAVTMFSHYRDNGEDRVLRDLTVAELPTLQRHLDEVDRLLAMS